MKYASIVPLIGGETIAMQQVFGKRPDYLLSYEAFADNDKHLLEYYDNEVPYHVLDREKVKVEKVDVVNAVCPCAGLSSLGNTAGSDNAVNDWMIKSSEYILESVNPTVFWGENAPRLASSMGTPIVNKLRAIGKKHGYTFSLYKTKSLLHGLPQIRDRSFYFFWKDSRVPMLPFYQKEQPNIADFLRSIKNDPNDPMSELVVKSKPSEHPWYKYVLEELEGGLTHSEFQDKLDRTWNMTSYIDTVHGKKFDEVAKYFAGLKDKATDQEWIDRYGRYEAKCIRMYDKLEAGKSIMRRNITVPKDKIGAFVGHLPKNLTHPDEDRFLTIRECLSIMSMPTDFQLQGGIKNLNHICQNVPVSTAADMAQGIRAYLDGKAEMIDTDYLLQDNKAQKNEYQSKASLENFL